MTGGAANRDPMCYCGHPDSKHDPSTRQCCAANGPNERCTCPAFNRALTQQEATPSPVDGEQNIPYRW